MGLRSSGDIFNAYIDKIVQEDPLFKNYARQVDDLLIWASSWEELNDQLERFFKLCEKYGLTLSPKKVQVAGPNQFVRFGGVRIGSIDGKAVCSADQEKLRTIRDYPAPTSQKEVRTLYGLFCQMALWYPELSRKMYHIRQLLRKDCAFNWSHEQQQELDELKSCLLQDRHVKPFNTEVLPQVITDFSNLEGYGYLIFQEEKKGLHCQGPPVIGLVVHN